MTRRIATVLFATVLAAAVTAQAAELDAPLLELDHVLAAWVSGSDVPRRTFAIRASAAIASPEWPRLRDIAATKDDVGTRMALGIACGISYDPSETCKSVVLALLASHHPLDNQVGLDTLAESTFPLKRGELLRALPVDDGRAAVAYSRLTRQWLSRALPLRDRDLERIAQTLGGRWTADDLAELTDVFVRPGVADDELERLMRMSRDELESLLLEDTPASLTDYAIEIAAIRGVPKSAALLERLSGLSAHDRAVAGIVFDDSELLGGSIADVDRYPERLSLLHLRPFIARLSEETAHSAVDALVRGSDGQPATRRLIGTFTRGRDLDDLILQLESDQYWYPEMLTISSSPDPRAITVRQILRREGALPRLPYGPELCFDDLPDPSRPGSNEFPVTGLARTLALLTSDHLPWTPMMTELEDALSEESRIAFDHATPHEVVLAILSRHHLTEGTSLESPFAHLTHAVHPELSWHGRRELSSDADTLSEAARAKFEAFLLREEHADPVAAQPLDEEQSAILERWLDRKAEKDVASLFGNVELELSATDCYVGYRDVEAGVRWPTPSSPAMGERQREILAQRLAADDVETRYRAAHLLWQYFRDPRGPEFLAGVVESSAGRERDQALRHLTTMRWRPATRFYLAGLHAASETERVVALGGVRELRLSAALPAVELALADPYASVREMACTAFVRMQRPGTWRMLLPLIDSSSCASWMIDPGDDLMPYLRSKKGSFDRHDRALIFRALDRNGIDQNAPTAVLFEILEQQPLSDGDEIEWLDDIVRRILSGEKPYTTPVNDLTGSSFGLEHGALRAWWNVEKTRPVRQIYGDAAERQLVMEGETDVASGYLSTLSDDARSAALRDLFRQWDLSDTYKLYLLLKSMSGDDFGCPSALPEPERKQAVRNWTSRLAEVER